LYDTNIIENDTYDNLLKLSLEFPISTSNEQGIMALYFTNIKPLFEQIKTHNEHTHFYDCLSRNQNNRYIMLKRAKPLRTVTHTAGIDRNTLTTFKRKQLKIIGNYRMAPMSSFFT